MPIIRGVEHGELIGENGEKIELPVSPRKVPKPKRKILVAPQSDELREAGCRREEFNEIAEGTTDTQVVAVELPIRRKTSRSRRKRAAPEE
ncbi:MAG: hypothetical protein WC841_04375 [Candidatus Shapirobacteria bacterium]|jgi:hypothetical protein